MIAHIRISDFAIIDSISIDFYPGLNIITGETGAGKSIIIEALSLALGSRGDSSLIRSGREKAQIQAVFDEIPAATLSLLKELGIAECQELIVTREISVNGKNICRINEQIVPVSVLSRLCGRLADIHGQYDHQSLLHPEHHLDFVDRFAAAELPPLLAAVRQAYREVKRLQAALADLEARESEALRKRDFMEFELAEITAVSLLPGEDESLEEEISLLQNSEQITSSLIHAYELLQGGDSSATTRIKKASDSLTRAEEFSRELRQQNEALQDCYYRLQDIAEELRRFRDRFSYDKDALDQAIDRQERIRQLKKKYGGTAESVLTHQKQLQEHLGLLEDASYNKDHLLKELASAQEILDQHCAALTALRRETGHRLKLALEAQLEELNFKNAEIQIPFQKIAAGENGADSAEFLIATNKGELPKSLAKTVSGGEMSRIMLAFKSILGQDDSIPSLIFDEIDNGISGITASVVGKKLRSLAREHQVLCITHLPQIAACGDHHYRISKEESHGRVTTSIDPLDTDGVLSELARLTGGLSVTPAALENARELLAAGKQE